MRKRRDRMRGEHRHPLERQLFPAREVTKNVGRAFESVGAERKDMSAFSILRRWATAGTAEQAPVAGDSRLDAWARNRGAALVESVVRATRTDA